jgi:rhamnose utilization protein RhaD (predicted bifunctional aldolase and dehydrogenase)
LKGIILEGHGLFTWGDSAKSCYETTLAIIKRAEEWLAANVSQPVFGGAAIKPLPAEQRSARRASDAALRGKISRDEYKLGHFDDSAAVLEFVCSKDLSRWRRWAPRARTTSCAPRSAHSWSTSTAISTSGGRSG